jgi:2'-5' RNA ligase
MKKNNKSTLVLAFPKISVKDYKWIQSIREKHDKIFYHVVEPHFTIVFPVFNFDLKSINNHIKIAVKNVKAIKFSILGATTVKDSFSDGADVFLIPDKGNSEIIKLHDKFYTGILLKELRLDIPFIPHIAIGRGGNIRGSKKIADKINKEKFLINGIINELDLVEYEYPIVKTINKFKLH